MLHVPSLRTVALGSLASALLSLAALPAHGAMVTVNGQVPGGLDPLGGTYAVGEPFGFGNFQEGAGQQPDPTQQVLFNPAGSGLANATAFTLTITGSNATILPLDRGFGNFFETFTPAGTILSNWDASISADGKSITYAAVPGEELLAGQRFSVDTTFSPLGDLPAGFAFSFTWTGDAAATAAVPEPASWAMMVCGFGLAGAALRRRKTVVAFA